MDVAKEVDKKLVKAALSASVDGQIWDLTRPLQSDCSIQILTWEDNKGKDVRLFFSDSEDPLAVAPKYSA